MYMKLIRQSSRLTFGDRITFSAVSGFCRDLGQTSSCYKERVGKNSETSECWPSPLSNRAENSSVTSHTTPPQYVVEQAEKEERNYKTYANDEAPAELLLLERRFLSRSRRIEGDEDLWREAEIKAFVVDTYTPYTNEANPLKDCLISPSPPLLAPGVVGKVLFSNKNLTNMPRFAEEWRRSAPPSPRFPSWRNINVFVAHAMAEAKRRDGDASVISAFNYAHWIPGRELYAPNYVKKKEGITFSDFFSDSLIISLLPPAQAGIMLEHEHIQHIISLNSNISLLHNGRREITQAWKDFVRLLGGPEASSHHCLIYFVKQSCRQFNGPNYIKLGTATVYV
ncbi:hypothetical protein G5I_10648 [Acromyrmex echinatior]|uniref:Uncharacterized protein n=1 Tax=Acromyrmex echinatior TaxID=103372 RepID=F4WXG3_ACREC|nr:hypothetical protein G5I_10648 [Acromyrmex echinatior]